MTLASGLSSRHSGSFSICILCSPPCSPMSSSSTLLPSIGTRQIKSKCKYTTQQAGEGNKSITYPSVHWPHLVRCRVSSASDAEDPKLVSALPTCPFFFGIYDHPLNGTADRQRNYCAQAHQTD